MFGALLLKGALETLKHRMDPEIYGRRATAGVPGTVIITRLFDVPRDFPPRSSRAAAALEHSGGNRRRIAAMEGDERGLPI
jgi:hypothetical protein